MDSEHAEDIHILQEVASRNNPIYGVRCARSSRGGFKYAEKLDELFILVITIIIIARLYK